MPLVASLIKIAALSLALLCVELKPMSVPVETAGVAKAAHTQCRIYFGCTPTAHLAAGIANGGRDLR